MPYRIEKINEHYCVQQYRRFYRSAIWQTLKCYEKQSDANQYFFVLDTAERKKKDNESVRYVHLSRRTEVNDYLFDYLSRIISEQYHEKRRKKKKTDV